MPIAVWALLSRIWFAVDLKAKRNAKGLVVRLEERIIGGFGFMEVFEFPPRLSYRTPRRGKRTSMFREIG